MASDADWWTTIRHGLPKIGYLVRNMRPSLALADIAAIDPDLLGSLGVQAVIWDVDGTLMPHHGHEVAEPFRDAFFRVVAASGTRHIMLSNADEARWHELGSIFPVIPVLRGYATPDGLVGRILLGGKDSWGAAEVRKYAVSGVRPLRKPSVELIELALAALGHPPLASVLMVGDQYLTDIAGANLAGIQSLKVSTHAPRSFPVAVRVLQFLEGVCYRIVYSPRPRTPPG